jgi:hypothetical protein
MRELRLEDFRSREGQAFELVLGESVLDFTLARVRVLPDSGREAGAFVLDWTGPWEPLLAQGIYTFRHGGDSFEMFIVPLSRGPESARYEAVFN